MFMQQLFVVQNSVVDDLEEDESEDDEEALAPSRVQRFRSLYMNLLTVGNSQFSPTT